MAPDPGRVASLLEHVGRDIILPRFRHLTPVDIERKDNIVDPDDVVTVADRLAEAALERELASLVPGSRVIGEEATHADPSLLELLAGDEPIWLLDPIDGTKNFIAGDDGFGTMLAYVEGGGTRMAWIHFPARRDTLAAEEGGGARLNGQAVQAPSLADGLPRGFMHVKYMPSEVRLRAGRASSGRFQPSCDGSASAVTCRDVLRGACDFSVYYRLFPWDHAAPALIVTEAGGVVTHLDGKPYTPRSADQVTIVAASRSVARQVSGWFGSTGSD